MRRKSKPIPKANYNDDKKVGDIAKKGGLQDVGGIEEANIIFNDGTVTQLTTPHVRGALASNAWTITGQVSQTTVNKLSPDMRGDNIQGGRAGAASGAAGNYNPMANAMTAAFQSAAMKFKAALDKEGITDAEISNPASQERIAAVLEKADLTPEERMALAALMPGMGGAGAEGEDVPELAAGKSFEDVAEAD